MISFRGGGRSGQISPTSLFEAPKNVRDAETTILRKFAFWSGLGRGNIYGKLSQSAGFPGKCHDNTIWTFLRILLSEILLSFGRPPKMGLAGAICSMFPQRVARCCFPPRRRGAPIVVMLLKQKVTGTRATPTAWRTEIAAIFAICDCDAHCRPQKSQRFRKQEKAMLHCDLRARWKIASDLRFRAAISEPKTHSFCRISGDLAPSTRKSLAIAMVRFWCAKP